MARLTLARQNLWAAIDATPAVKSQLKRMYRFDSTDPAGNVVGALSQYPPKPAAADMPALALMPTRGDTPWNANQSQKLSYSLEATLWTPTWNLPPAEALWEAIVVCWWKTVNTATGIEYWRGNPSASQGVWDMDIRTFTFQPWKIEPDNPDSPFATRLDWSVTLVQNWNPRA
jgi:hypothetical protein